MLGLWAAAACRSAGMVSSSIVVIRSVHIVKVIWLFH